MSYPTVRMRRLRRSDELRALARETRLSVDDLIAPLFVTAGRGVGEEIASLPGQKRLSAELAAKKSASLRELGIKAVLLFGIAGRKDETGSEAADRKGVVQEAVRAIKAEVPSVVVIADVCLCQYTSHGHCGVIVDGEVDNDRTLGEIEKQTLSLAAAGVDVLAPSGMMDGVVQAMRLCLDDAGYEQTAIMSYSAKYASAYYGPFREAVGSAPRFGDRRSYQMDPANAEEALREIELDLIEGADIIMVKPALAYLDVIRRAREAFAAPLAAYNVSGEYAMIAAAAERGWIDREAVMMETLVSIKRAGADMIISYFAEEAARRLA